MKISKKLREDLEYYNNVCFQLRVNKYLSIIAFISEDGWDFHDREEPEIFWLEVCPICNSKESGAYGAFRIDLEMNTFKCTQCHARGGVYDFIKLSLKLDDKQAVQYIKDIFK